MQITVFLYYLIQVGILTIIYLIIYTFGFLAASKGAKLGIPGLENIKIGFLVLIFATIFIRLSNVLITYYVLSSAGDVIIQYSFLIAVSSLVGLAINIFGFTLIIIGIRTLVSQYRVFGEV